MSRGRTPPGDRLQKVLSRAGVASRRASEDLIRRGEVTINGRIAELGDRVVSGDAVKVGNRLVTWEAIQDKPHVHLALHKPEGTMTTASDPEGRPTVFDLVPPRYRRGLTTIGRLDFGTEGLLLLTTDGDLAQRVSHPRYGCSKHYLVKVKGVPEEKALDRLRRGMRLDGVRLNPCVVEPHRAAGSKNRSLKKNSWWRVELSEGRTRQVRRMFERIGHPVSRLRRVAVGPVRLGRLAKGEVRELTEAEVEGLRRTTRSSG